MSLLRKIIAGVGDLITDAYGVQKVSLPTSLFNGLFVFDIPPAWFKYENGSLVGASTAITSVNSQASIVADAVITTAKLESRECFKYRANRGHLVSMSITCPSKTAGGIREWGACTNENGVFFRLKADGLLYAVLRRNSVEVLEEEIDTSVLTSFDIEKNNLYDIQFQWRGAGNYKFFISNPATGQSKLVHTFSLIGTLTTSSIYNPALPACFKSTYTTQTVTLIVGCVDITSENGNTQKEQYYPAAANNVATAITGTPILCIHVPDQIGGQTNTRSVNFLRVSVFCDKKATFNIYAARNPAAITGATFVAMGGGTYVETDSPDISAGAVRATAYNTALMVNRYTASTAAGIRNLIELPGKYEGKLALVRGDYLVITCSATAGTADVLFEFGEEQ